MREVRGGCSAPADSAKKRNAHGTKSHLPLNIINSMRESEVGKVNLKSNGDEALSDEFLLKSSGDEALNDIFL